MLQHMGDMVNVNKNVSNGFGIAGFVLSLLGLILGLFLQIFFSLAIVGTIFSVIQLRRRKTGLGTAGLIIGVIGIVLLLAWFVVLVFINNSVVSTVEDKLALNGSLGTEGSVPVSSTSPDDWRIDGPVPCLDVLASVFLEDACRNEENIEVNLDFRMWHDLEEVEFVVGDYSVRMPAPKEASFKEFILDTESNAGEELQITLFLDGEKCGDWNPIRLKDC